MTEVNVTDDRPSGMQGVIADWASDQRAFKGFPGARQ